MQLYIKQPVLLLIVRSVDMSVHCCISPWLLNVVLLIHQAG